MATVTGLTAARMLAIEAATVVSGVIDGTGHMVLTKHDGTTIDAGSVPGAVPSATTSVQGTVVLADNTTTATGTDAAKAVTPAGLASLVANTSQKGIVSLADNTTTAAATDSTKAVTPAGLGSVLSGKVNNGAAVTVVGGGKETISSATASTSTTTVDLANGNVQTVTLGSNTTFTLNGATNGVACSLSLYLKQDGTGSRLVTWPSSVKWPGAAAPQLSTGANKIDLVVLETLDGGTTWYGSLAGADYR